MPAYTLEYFDAKARGELIRLVFAEAGEKYEDKRFTFEEWPKHKPGEFMYCLNCEGSFKLIQLLLHETLSTKTVIQCKAKHKNNQMQKKIGSKISTFDVCSCEI